MSNSLQILRPLMGKYLFILALIITNVFASFSQDSIPEWFVYSGKYPNLFLGFTSQRYTATSDVKCRYAIQKYATIKGCVENANRSFNGEFSDYYLKNIWFEFSSKDSIEASSVLNLYSGFCTNVLFEEFVFAYSLDSIPLIQENKSLNINNLPKPEWVEQTAWLEDDEYYGVGVYIGGYNFNDAWITSEDLALKNLLDFFQMSIESKNVTVIDGDIELNSSVMTLTFNHEIHNYRLLERWFDPEKSLCYSLVRLRVNDIKRID